jgi:hypothetical protein
MPLIPALRGRALAADLLTLRSVLRILDLDLDLFVDGAAYWKASKSERLKAEDFPPWPREEALSFLERSCGLTAKLPGFVVEHHAELFACWRESLSLGVMEPPFCVTHVDGHADLGLGDSGYMYLMTELLLLPPEERRFPRTGPGGLDDGNWLAFAIACRWVGDLVYVLNTSGPPGDLFPYYMEGYLSGADRELGFAGRAKSIELAAMDEQEVKRLHAIGGEPLRVQRFEPKVPFRWVPSTEFSASAPFDLVCLARSPGFTPVESDELFEEIRERFIDETAFA